ncbi:uncharacterized protein L969DRAFT_19491 [Mixia osmundae IAM 14324]|uniref:EF-hand domain-containing protein n=1 Tax=Mixia osmundae (strain CBS 9802 / IAM 14324 / JCM 22182 / KY 12970) TaxID=764103 RepID=G7DUT4_MIXOS|nr:uncharacterized protein L969DRAFT_19491 [Mixia osmundae IAM 14324]KEI37438.1 hypothetical protein L969DRAFT_19491 [Mixia osmundae IAM 14324]GAA94344.1 hypothetical protein E5Q_00995 [Mixia osmundae IAM 14324]
MSVEERRQGVRESDGTSRPAGLLATRKLSKREAFELMSQPRRASSSTYLDSDVSLREASDIQAVPPPEQSLETFRQVEGPQNRLSRLRRLFEALKQGSSRSAQPSATDHDDKAAHLHHHTYADELWQQCREGENEQTFSSFVRYAEAKEHELWKVFNELDRNNDRLLDAAELRAALERAGIQTSNEQLKSFLNAIDKDRDGHICFSEWRDFLLLLPRSTSVPEIYHYYQQQRGVARHPSTVATQDGDVTLGERTQTTNKAAPPPVTQTHHPDPKGKAKAVDEPSLRDQQQYVQQDTPQDEEDEEDERGMFDDSLKYLLAGGIAGAVSRTATAPFDRLKVYLITNVQNVSAPIPKDLVKKPGEALNATAEISKKGARVFREAIASIYKQDGLKGFYIGNGLNTIKIFPESAIKFLSYESSKRFFAKYVDNVEKTRDISGTSRFFAGGIGGLSSQLSIYGIETLKTRVMSSTANKLKGNALVIATAKQMWKEGGVRAYYRGLTWGLVGVFPYSGIDFACFEFLKRAYQKYYCTEEMGLIGSLAFGAFSGGVGAASVYPLNLARTRLQAAGSPAHPQTYTGIRDVVSKTYRHEGVRGFYKGLTPTILKVAPAVSISWATYETAQKFLFPAGESHADDDDNA